MHFIDLTKDLILFLLTELKKGLKKHKIFAFVFPIAGILIALLTFILFDVIKEKLATVLFGISGCFIGTIFVFQIQEITKDGKKISALSALDKNINEAKLNPSADGSTEDKIYDLFKETFKETIKS
ncbi:MAG: hypothetical protein ABI091_05965 [Ferruginibacter sp.]